MLCGISPAGNDQRLAIRRPFHPAHGIQLRHDCPTAAIRLLYQDRALRHGVEDAAAVRRIPNPASKSEQPLGGDRSSYLLRPDHAGRRINRHGDGIGRKTNTPMD